MVWSRATLTRVLRVGRRVMVRVSVRELPIIRSNLGNIHFAVDACATKVAARPGLSNND